MIIILRIDVNIDITLNIDINTYEGTIQIRLYMGEKDPKPYILQIE